ncbi:MAG: AraC family transcriptional regulator [Afipia sp.]|nr:AraC family transcriptional regulator [Afipia sp.]
MKTVFSTKLVHQRDKFDFWHSIACKNIVDHDSRPANRLSFEAEIDTGSFGLFELVLFRNSSMRVSHTMRHITHTRSDHLLVCRQISGSIFLEQDTREIALEAGDVTLLDPLRPYDGRFSECSATLVLKVPRRELEVRIGKIRDMTTRLVKPVRVEDDLTLSLLAKLPSLAGKMNPISEEMVGSHALDLVAVSLAMTLDGRQPRVSSGKALVVLNIRSVIEARLSDPTLDAQTVADAVGVSVRYANDILADHDTSIVRLIQARRLARCRSALQDPNQSHRMVSEIAHDWDFST